MSSPPQIFISYAREDYAVVKQLYHRLKGAGYKLWMDKVDLSKGADFAKAIPKVLRESDLFIVCLSNHSVSKRSFIQREINLALDILEEKLGDDLYIFPVRLEACVAPDRISGFNWTDWFGDEHEEEWQVLLAALSAQAERLGKTTAAPPQAVITVPPAPKPAQPEPLVLPKSYTENLNGVPLEMILVPTGKFMRGSDKFDNEKPPHEVRVPSFCIGKFQITQKQWKAVMGNNPSRFKGDELPVEQVSWHDAQSFGEKLRAMTGKAYRLPSEAEWEYACRAGTTGDYPGEFYKFMWYSLYAGKLNNIAWHSQNSNEKTHPVGQKMPNAFGLYDMHGNVGEWCKDVWHDNYRGAPSDGSAWVVGGDPQYRVWRSESWRDYVLQFSPSARHGAAPDVCNNRRGLRVAVTAISS